MPSLHDLPADILREIFSSCDPRALTETCHYFSAVIYSLPQFADIHVGPRQLDPDLLRSRLGRISAFVSKVSIGPIEKDIVETPLVESICALLAERNVEINHLEITGETASAAGRLLNSIFSLSRNSSITFPKLQRLSVQVQREIFSDYTSVWPQLDLVLEHATEKFPKLQNLSLSDFFECIPTIHGTLPFSNIHTLILDGSVAGQDLCTRLIINLLQNTPLLESLWLKHSTELMVYTAQESQSKMSTSVPSYVTLSHLTSLAVSIPGFTSELLHCINAPALRDLHLDASMYSYSGDKQPFFFWASSGIRPMDGALISLAQKSTNLQRLAITALYLREEDWNWLMFSGPPFPRLESLALHGLKPIAENLRVDYKFDNSLLLRCSQYQGPMVSLKRLAVLNCELDLTGSVLIKALMSRLNGLPKDGFELELDDNGPQFSKEEIIILGQIGVRLIRHKDGEVKVNNWWRLGHNIDPSDSYAY